MTLVLSIITLRTRTSQARHLADLLARSAEDARAMVEDRMHDPLWRDLPPEHHEAVRSKYEREFRTARTRAAGVGLYHLEHDLPHYVATAREERLLGRVYPGPMEAYVKRSGGKVELLDERTALLVQILDASLRAQFDRELATATPGQVRDRYTAALVAASENADCFIRWAEDRHGQGWAGANVGLDHLEDAKALRRAIDTAQNARVPPEVGELEGVIAEAQKLIQRVTTIGRVTPINPKHNDNAAKAYETELTALDAQDEQHKGIR
jgi:hypothetical protein